ncbi:MAG: MarP family serine protease [Actinomycetota bacterium]
MEQQAAFGWAVDLLIVGAVALAVMTGYRRGAMLQLFSWGGFVLGLFVGGIISPRLVDAFGPSAPAAKAITGVILFLGVAFVTEAIIAVAGGTVLRRITNLSIKKADRLAGSTIAAVMAILSAWVLSVPAKRAPQLAASIRDSVVLRATYAVLPDPPDVIAGLGGLLNHTGFPEVFQQLNPSLAPGVEPAPESLKDDAQILAAARVTYKVESRGCGGLVDGSGFSIRRGYVMTAAHVLAGTKDHKVLEPSDGGGRAYDAVPVYMDTKKDIAVLRVPGLERGRLGLADSPAERGTDGAAIGYPGGGDRRISVARVRARTDAVGRDIYSRRSVTREIYVLRARVRQGNSGGPLVDEAGRVRGLIFAASAQDAEESYALTEAEIRHAQNAGAKRSSPVKTGSCAI